MRILYIVTRGDVIGGASMHVLELAAEMLRRGHQVTLLIGPGEVVARLAVQRGLTVIVEPALTREISLLNDVRCLFKFIFLIKRLNPAVIHLHSAKAGLLGRLAARVFRIPTVYSVHGWAFNMYRGIFATCYQYIERTFMRLTNLLVLVCQSDVTHAKHLGLPANFNMCLVHNGIADNQQQAQPGSKSLFRIICVARFEEPKDQQTLLHALSLLTDDNWQMTFVGSGPNLQKCKELANELELANIVFAGERDDVPNLLQESDIFVISSKSESLPVSVIEAMRAALPVVATNVGGMSELIDSERTGWLVPPGDAAALAGKIQFLMSNPGICLSMGLAGRQKYCDQFTLKQQCDKLEALYYELMGTQK